MLPRRLQAKQPQIVHPNGYLEHPQHQKHTLYRVRPSFCISWRSISTPAPPPPPPPPPHTHTHTHTQTHLYDNHFLYPNADAEHLRMFSIMSIYEKFIKIPSVVFGNVANRCGSLILQKKKKILCPNVTIENHFRTKSALLMRFLIFRKSEHCDFVSIISAHVDINISNWT